MNDSSNKPDSTGKHSHAYANMLERVRQGLESTEDDVATRLHYVIDAAKEKAFEMGELTREEAEKVGDYLQRDIQDASSYLAQEGKQLGDWLKFDVELVEERLAELLTSTLDQAVNPTNLELQQLAETAAEENLWYTGEVIGPGTLVCENCGQELNFYHIQDIPGCPKCDGTIFKRVSRD
jgi:hypothetical protein